MDTSVRLLGPMVVEYKGCPIIGFRSAKTMALLAFLICERRPVSRGHLADLLWPGAPESVARGHLRRALHDLTHKLPGVVLSDYHTAQFSPEYAVATDIARFEQLRAQADPVALEAAAALCGGEFLEGLSPSQCPDFDLWLVVERELWRKRALDVLESLLHLCIRLTDFDRACEMAWQILKLEPTREDIHRHLMILLARTGNPGMALKQYKRCRRILADELDIEPSEATTRLYERIRRAMTNPAPPFPRPPGPFPGRPEQLDALLRHVADADCRLVAIVGPRGSDRGRLAAEAATRLEDRRGRLFLDGIYPIPLASARTGQELAAAVARALANHSGRPVSSVHLHRYLRDREFLLILDDFDDLLPHKEYLQELLAESPALKLIVASPEPLRLPGERVLALDA